MLLIQKAGLATEFTQDIIHSLWENRDGLNSMSEEWLHDCTESYGEFNSLLYRVNKLYTKLMTEQSNVTVENAHEFV